MTRSITADDAKAVLEQALQHFAPDWDVIDECLPVNMGDPSHWPSGVQSVRTVLRHRTSGRGKVLGQRIVDGSDTTCHRALSLVVLDAYRNGNTDPMRRYLEEIAVLSAAGGRSASLSGRAAFARTGARPVPSVASSLRGARSQAPSSGRAYGGVSPSGNDTDLQGSFVALGLVEILQGLSLARRTGRLLLTFERESGGLVLEVGVPVHAQIGMQIGPTAFVALLAASERERSARFVFRSEPSIGRDEPRTIHDRLEQLLFAAAAAIDEEDGAEVVSLEAARVAARAV